MPNLYSMGKVSLARFNRKCHCPFLGSIKSGSVVLQSPSFLLLPVTQIALPAAKAGAVTENRCVGLLVSATFIFSFCRLNTVANGLLKKTLSKKVASLHSSMISIFLCLIFLSDSFVFLQNSLVSPVLLSLKM